jgi:serine/threonine protein phosphatase PrpC
VHDGAAKKAELTGMGSTLVAAIVGGDEVRWISVGDSPFYMVSAGKLERLNADHSMAPQIDALVARGVITAEEGAEHPGRHTLREAVMGQPLALIDEGKRSCPPTPACCFAATACIASARAILLRNRPNRCRLCFRRCWRSAARTRTTSQ